MSTQLTIQVNVSFTPETVALIQSLFSGIAQPVQALPKKEEKKVEAPPVKQDAAKPTTEVKPTEQKAEEPTTSAPSVDIETIRSVLGTKVEKHREVIKAELEKCGAKNVTTLDVKHYDSFYKFLNGLQ